MTHYPQSRQTDIVVQDLESEVLIYDLQIDNAYCLNETSSMVWQLCDGKNSIAEISRLLSRKLKISVNEELIWLALDQFSKNNLLEKSAELPIEFEGLNRRQIIKKIGLASMIALPIVSSIVAPKATMAASGLALLSACSSNAQCASGACHTCLSGTCTGSSLCCSNPTGLLGPTFSFGCSATSSICSSQAGSCCSGAVTFVPPGPGCDCTCT